MGTIATCGSWSLLGWTGAGGYRYLTHSRPCRRCSCRSWIICKGKSSHSLISSLISSHNSPKRNRKRKSKVPPNRIKKSCTQIQIPSRVFKIQSVSSTIKTSKETMRHKTHQTSARNKAQRKHARKSSSSTIVPSWFKSTFRNLSWSRTESSTSEYGLYLPIRWNCSSSRRPTSGHPPKNIQQTTSATISSTWQTTPSKRTQPIMVNSKTETNSLSSHWTSTCLNKKWLKYGQRSRRSRTWHFLQWRKKLTSTKGKTAFNCSGWTISSVMIRRCGWLKSMKTHALNVRVTCWVNLSPGCSMMPSSSL